MVNSKTYFNPFFDFIFDKTGIIKMKDVEIKIRNFIL